MSEISQRPGRRAPGRLLLRAAALLPLAELGLATLGLARTRAWLVGRRPATPGAAAGGAGAGWREAEAVDRAVRRAGRLVRARCLARSLVTLHLLVRRGLAAELCIGVRRDAGALRAHAWVEVEGRPLGEAEEIPERFAVLEGGDRG